MARTPVGEGVDGRVRALVLVAAVACTTLSLLYLLGAAAPVAYFHGYVVGYYSLLGYRLYYAHDLRPVLMPHTDYVRHVSLTFALLSASLMVASIASAALARRRPLGAAGLVYGAASGSVVLYGLLCGYIHRAIELDLGRFNGLLGDTVVYRTLAGTITFEGIRVERTLVYAVVHASPAPVILLALAAASSAAAAVLSLHTIYVRAQTAPGPGARPPRLKRLLSYSTLILTSFSTLASVFAYYPAAVAVVPQPPPVTLEAPPYAYTCAALTRTARGVLAYTDCETYPIPGWTSYGGSWSSASGVAGAKGNVLRGQDDNRGVGGSSHYCYNADLSNRASLWVATKTRLVSGTGWYGISMLNTGRNRLYEVSISTGGYLEIWSFNVVTANRWERHAQATIPGYTPTAWYILVTDYTAVGTTTTMRAYLYDSSGNYVTSVSATVTSTNVFSPAYIGVAVDGPTAYSDEFIISTSDPRSIYFTGFAPGMRVEVWDNLGYSVNSTTAQADSFNLNVRGDIVVGTGADGRILVRYPDGFQCLSYVAPTVDAILGGDGYSLTTRPVYVSLGANRTSAGVSIHIPSSAAFSASARFLGLSASQVLYARLVLDSVSAPAALDLDLWLEGATRSTNVTIRGGVPVSSATSDVQLNLGPNNFLALAGRFTAAGQSATLRLRLELCAAPGGVNACVYYPLTVVLTGG